MKIFNLFRIKIIKKVNIKKQNKIDECKSLFNSIDLKYANEKIEMIKPFYDWFMNTVNKEAEKIVASDFSMPSKVVLKYPLSNKNSHIIGLSSYFGDMEVVINENMECLFRVE
jgi:hypothetical protein